MAERIRSRLRRWWRLRPFIVPVWEAGNEWRWAMSRRLLLDQRGITDEEANDAR